MTEKLPTKVVGILECKQSAVRAVRFNTDGSYCMTCGSDKTIKLWNPHRFLHIKTYIGHGYEVLDVVGSVDNSHLASGGADKTVILWDVATGNTIRKFRGHIAKVNCVNFNEESTVILSGSLDSSLRIWDCRSKNNDPIQILNEAKDSVSSIQISDHEIVTASVDGCVRNYDLRAGRMNKDCIGKPVTCVNYTRDGQCILASSLDNTLRLLDKDTGEMLGEYLGHQNSKYKVDSCLTSSDTHVISGSEDGRICYWNLVEGTMTDVGRKGDAAIHSISHHPSEDCLLSASEGQVKLWRPQTFMSST